MTPRPAPPLAETPLIPKYFAGKELLITGGTGFVGKVLIERLLSTCPDICRIHLLLRSKKGKPPEARLKQLKMSQVFDELKERSPQQLDKLSAVGGDLREPELGLDAHAVYQLNQVSVVFHSAATLKFDETLRLAVEYNLRPVLKIMDLCDKLPMIQVLMYVSTAYSNAELSSVEERVYEAPAPLEQVLALVDQLPDHLLANITPGYIAPKPNTYTFTKAMAESAVAERARAGRAAYATAIFRPSIVVASVRHPVPGWVENLAGPTGMVVGAGKGLLHVVTCSPQCRADMVPVDIVIDTMIAAVWDTAHQHVVIGDEPLVYNCSSCENPTTWGEFKTRLIRGVRAHPFDDAVWWPFGFCIENRVLMKISEWVLQVAPLYTADLVYTALGIEPKVRPRVVLVRMRAAEHVLRYFMTHEWRFDTSRVRQLRDKLAPPDAATYHLDVRTIDWEEHCVKLVQGARRYLQRESDDSLPRARRRMRLLQVLHIALQLLLVWAASRVALSLWRALSQLMAA